VNIYSTVPGLTADGTGRVDSKSGTSQATPFVSGALGYLMSYYQNTRSAENIVSLLKSSADFKSLYSASYNKLYRACYSGTNDCDNLLGSGFLNLENAVKNLPQQGASTPSGKAVTTGCIVSKIGSQKQPVSESILVLLPLLLLAFFCRSKSRFSK
jgi:subtilisin family serine protease